MLKQIFVGILFVCINVSYGQESKEEELKVIFNPKPENISLLKNTPPQYKFYVDTPKGSTNKQGGLEQRYRAEKASKQAPQRGDGGKGAKARQEGLDKRRGDAKANRNID